MLYRPEFVLLLGFLTYVLVWVCAPLQATVKLSLGCILFIGLCSLSLALGSFVSDLIKRSHRSRYRPRGALALREKYLFLGTFAIGLLGVTLRLYDKYILRGVADLSGFAARQVLADSDASALSILGGMLYPFAYVPLFVYLASRCMRKRRIVFIAAILLFMVPALDALNLHSRSSLLVAFAMTYFGVCLILFRGSALPRALIPALTVGVVIIAFLSIQMFLWRLDEMGLNSVDSITQSGYAFTVPPDEETLQTLAGSSWGSRFLGAGLPILQYYTHGLFEFQILWNEFPSQDFTVGALAFAPYAKALSMIGLAGAVDLSQFFPRVGVFTTFFGPVWVDFGWFAPFIMFLFGLLARTLGRGLKEGDLGAAPIYTYFCVILFFAPVVNFMVSAQGVYVINAFLIFWLFTRGHSRVKPMAA